MRKNEVEVVLVSEKPYDLTSKPQVVMPPPIVVNVDSSYKPKRSMVKKYVATAAKV